MSATTPEDLGSAYAELEVIDGAGRVTDRTVPAGGRPEAVLVHFGGLTELDPAELARSTRLLLDAQPAARGIYDRMSYSVRLDGDSLLPLIGVTAPPLEQEAMSYVVYQYTLLHLMRLCRPAIFAQLGHYVEATDPIGWLAALAGSGALSLQAAVDGCGAHLWPGSGSGSRSAVLDQMLAELTTADVPVIGPGGSPLRLPADLAEATSAVFGDTLSPAGPRPIRLDGNCQVLSLAPALDPTDLDAGPHRVEVVSVRSPSEIWRRHVNPALDEFEDRSTVSLTDESERVLRHAQGRNLLSSMVNAYVAIDEPIVGFGQGGSESMTIFVERAGVDGVVVRKILSEALTTADWSSEGQGVMLPPFAKARKQAEYLQALPESVRHRFPLVYDIHERDIPVPRHLRADGRTTYKELIYEMSFVPGQEVSRFVERHSPPPAVVARLYEEVFRVLGKEVHGVGRVAAPGGTIEVSYLRKIEERLALCHRTAPLTFGPDLLGSEQIIIDGASYLNAGALLRRFRERPDLLAILEPRFHSLVMGDTNTENIKVTDVGPLLRAQQAIESGASPGEIESALAAITAESLGVKFLDPRAIGFQSDGQDTRDDPMYDNKPWHNSIGHYDEIHNEQFTLRVDAGDGRVPAVDVEFRPGNPYQRAYRVRDVEARGGTVGLIGPDRGMEDYFAQVMTAAYGLDRPDPDFLRDDPHWLVRFVFVMGTHFTAMPPFHLQTGLDGTLTDTYQHQRRAVAIYCQGVKWLNWALHLLTGQRTEFLGLKAAPLGAA